MTVRKDLKRRYYIDQAKSSQAKQGSSNLYWCDDNTRITFSDSGSLQLSDDSETAEDLLSEKYIGGLQDQMQKLNMRLKWAVGKAKLLNAGSARNKSILIHGFEGTGKSLILDRLQRLGPCRTYALKKSSLDTSNKSKGMETISNIFKDARSKQPALVLMDDINKLAPANDETFVDTISQGLKHIVGSRVLVLATCRNPRIAAADNMRGANKGVARRAGNPRAANSGCRCDCTRFSGPPFGCGMPHGD